MALKHLIQNKLLDHIETSTLIRKTKYDGNNRASLVAIEEPPLTGANLLASRHANEIASNFANDPRHGRSHKLERSQWTFQLRVVFKTEVSLEDFEEAWSSDPPILSRADTSSKQVTLLLSSSEITHPPQKTSSTGTSAVFTILAKLSRN